MQHSKLYELKKQQATMEQWKPNKQFIDLLLMYPWCVDVVWSNIFHVYICIYINMYTFHFVHMYVHTYLLRLLRNKKKWIHSSTPTTSYSLHFYRVLCCYKLTAQISAFMFFGCFWFFTDCGSLHMDTHTHTHTFSSKEKFSQQ